MGRFGKRRCPVFRAGNIQKASGQQGCAMACGLWLSVWICQSSQTKRSAGAGSGIVIGGICKKQLLLYVYERETGEGYAAAGISFFGHYAATGSYKKKDKENNGTATCVIASAVQPVWGFRNWNPMKTEVVAAAMECAGEEQPEGIHIIRGQDIRTYGK